MITIVSNSFSGPIPVPCSKTESGFERCVLIVMSVYNGEAYLYSQLMSIKHQRGICPHLLIRDDSSQDKSLMIIKLFLDSRDILQTGPHLGPLQSYFKLLVDAEGSTFDYVAWSDQDDLWKHNKIEHAVTLLEKEPNIQLYCSNRTPFGLFQQKFQLSVISHSRLLKIEDLIGENQVFGCTIVMKKSFLTQNMKILLPELPYLDFQLGLIAALANSCFFDVNSYILYRRHTQNDSRYGDLKLNSWKLHMTSFRARLHLIFLITRRYQGRLDDLGFFSKKRFFLTLLRNSNKGRIRKSLGQDILARLLIMFLP